VIGCHPGHRSMQTSANKRNIQVGIGEIDSIALEGVNCTLTALLRLGNVKSKYRYILRIEFFSQVRRLKLRRRKALVRAIFTK
jgi:hypothetical protein